MKNCQLVHAVDASSNTVIVGVNNNNICVSVTNYASDQQARVDTKYDLLLKQKQNYRSKLASCCTLRQWVAQNKLKFGYIPLGDLHPPSQTKPYTSDKDQLSLHHIIKKIKGLLL